MIKAFRGNQCSFYLIVESIINLCQISVLLTGRILIKINGYDPADYSIFWCKIRTIVYLTLILISVSIICFAAFDQYLSTSVFVNLRQLSTLKLAQLLTFIAICIWLFHSILFGIYSNILPIRGCVISNVIMSNYTSFFIYPILCGILPIIVSSTFSLLAFRNVRRIIRRQIPIIRRRLDQQLTVMVFIRVIFLIILILPFIIYRIYILNIISKPTEPLGKAIESLFIYIATILFNFNYSVNFYIFLVCSSRYRRQVKYVLKRKCWQQVRRCWIQFLLHRNQVEPIRVISTTYIAD